VLYAVVGRSLQLAGSAAGVSGDDRRRHVVMMPLSCRQPLDSYCSLRGRYWKQTKGQCLRRDLRRRGFSDKQIGSFFCSMGLPIGNNTPAEIAISVVAQLIQVRDETKLAAESS